MSDATMPENNTMTHDHSGDQYIDITEFGSFHDANDHSDHDSLEGGRTAITTEALVAYNGIRAFFGKDAVEMEEVGQWAFDNNLTNNAVPYGQDLQGVGLYYAMQGAKVAWIRDDMFDPQILADIQRIARLGTTEEVMEMVETYGEAGFADYLRQTGLVDEFVNTLKMEPHYGGWMHGRVHGWLTIPGEDGGPAAIAHDINHLTVLSHDQTQPFMNDTFDYPQWPALDVPEQDVIDYFQSMITLGEPLGDSLPSVTAQDLSAQGDNFEGTSYADHVNGLDGQDTLNGKGGKDVLFGGKGADVLNGGDGADRLFGEGAKDELYGGKGADVLMGGGGADKVVGGKGDDQILGGGGDDTLRGNEGNDTLTDGSGSDLMIGNEGRDIFVFVTDGEVDKIKDFENGKDLIALEGVMFSDLAITNTGSGDVKIAYGDETILLKDQDGSLSASDLTAADFLFS